MLFTITATKVFNVTKTDQNLYTDLNNYYYIDQDIVAVNSGDNSLDTLSANFLILRIDSLKGNQLDSLKIKKDGKDIYTITSVNLEVFKLDTHVIHKKYLTDDYLTFYENGVIIQDVFEGGVSEQAGLKSGDIILSVNRQYVESAREADNMIQSTETGGKIHYEILRNRDIYEIPVDVITYEIKIYEIIYFVIGLITLGLGLYIGLRKPKMKVARLASLSLVMLGALIANGFNMMGTTAIIPTRLTFILTSLSWVFIAAFTYPVTLHSLFYFPIENKVLVKSKWIYKSFYMITVLIVILRHIMAIYTGNSLILSLTSSIGNYIIFLYMGIFIVILLFTTNIEDIKKVKPVYISHIILLISLIFINSIPIFFTNSEFISNYESSNLSALFILALPLPFAYYMTIGNYHLLDLNIRFSRNILYVTAVLILRVILGGIFVFIAYKLITMDWNFPNIIFSRTVVSLTDAPVSAEFQSAMEHITIFISLMTTILILRYILKKAQERIDEIFNKVNIDFRTLSARLGQIAKHSENNTDELVNTAVNTIATGLMLKKSGVWLFNDDKLISHKYFGISLNIQLTEFANLYAKEILYEMREFKRPIPIDYLSNAVKDVLSNCGFEYVILLNTKEKNIGLLFIGEKLLESKFTKEDLTFLSDISEHTAVVLENALMRQDIIKQERLKNEVELARKIQMASMPKTNASIPGLDTAAISKPAYEVGGDFFDFYRQEGTKLAVIVGDVSGKGTSAALYMSNALGIVRTLSSFTSSPRDILCNMNDLIKKQIKKGNFITAVTAEADTTTQEMQISRAGHTPVYHFKSSNKEITKYQPNGLALGLTGSLTFDKILREQTIKYDIGDIFIFITDGVCEARNESKEEIGDSLIYKVLNSYHEYSADKILATLMKLLEQTTTGNYVDDVTALIIKAVKA